MKTRERLNIYITNVLNNPKDFCVDEVVEHLISNNFLVCNPQKMTIEQYNWLCEQMDISYLKLKQIELKQPPKKL
jgi:hypothetical protein